MKLNKIPFIFLYLCIATPIVSTCEKSNNRGEQKSALLEARNPVEKYAETITRKALKKHITSLASNKMEGRFSGTRGARKAAAYLTGHLRSIGLKDPNDGGESYIQSFEMQKKKLVECILENENGRVENWEDFAERFSHFSGEKDADLVFAGYGRPSELSGLDVKGKLVSFFIGGPESSDFNADREREKINRASERGAIGHLLILRDEEARNSYQIFRKAYYGDVRYYLKMDQEEALRAERRMAIFPSAMAELFGIDADALLSVIGDPDRRKNLSGRYRTRVHMKTSYESYGTVQGRNVLGVLEGSDKKDEWIVLTAHYDHLGTHRGDTYNGADDNASGMAAVLEIAGVFARAAVEGHRPRRSILFLFPDAEEIGANGSLYYMDHPAVPLNNTVVDVNIDAIGREDADRPDLKDYVYIYRSRNGRGNLDTARGNAEKSFAERLKIEIRETPPGSDNTIFERNGVPVLAYTTGRSRDYHKPTDTSNKIHYDNLETITRLIFTTVWEIANEGKRIQ